MTVHQINSLITKGKTVSIKGFDIGGVKKDGILKLTSDFNIELDSSMLSPVKEKKSSSKQCPKCKEGTVIKGKTAFGCSNWKAGCDYRLAFSA